MPIVEHVVVLMLENRSFDNLLGQLYPKSDPFDGIDLAETNPWHRPDGIVETIRAWTSRGSPAPPLPNEDPGEFFDDIVMQLCGLRADTRGPPSMEGFIDNYMRQPSEVGEPKRDPWSIMHQFAPEQSRALATLARAFGVSDRWYASAPCETWPNGYFTHCGTAGGYVNNERTHFPYRWPRFLRTIFRRLDSRGYNWRVYFHDLPQSATLIELWPKIPTRFCLFEDEFERHTLGPVDIHLRARKMATRWIAAA